MFCLCVFLRFFFTPLNNIGKKIDLKLLNIFFSINFFLLLLAPFDRIVDQELRSQYFKFPSNIYHQHVQKAFLWIYLKGSSQLKTSSRIVIYQVVRNKQTPLLMVSNFVLFNSNFEINEF